MTISEFLLARIAEDEALARAAAESVNDHASRYAASEYAYDEPLGRSWAAADYGMVRGENLDLWDCEGSDTLCTTPAAARHIARHDPARVLAACAAKRSIITSRGSFVKVEATASGFGEKLSSSSIAKGLELSIQFLAAAYSDHPDYRQEWAA